MACAFDHSWLCHYPRPLICLHNKGTKFTGIEFQELFQSYGIKAVIATTANPQTNAILECTHQVMHPLSNCESTLIPSLDVHQTQLFGQHPT
jgi:transposase InsO family protein